MAHVVLNPTYNFRLDVYLRVIHSRRRGPIRGARVARRMLLVRRSRRRRRPRTRRPAR